MKLHRPKRQTVRPTGGRTGGRTGSRPNQGIYKTPRVTESVSSNPRIIRFSATDFRLLPFENFLLLLLLLRRRRRRRRTQCGSESKCSKPIILAARVLLDCFCNSIRISLVMMLTSNRQIDRQTDRQTEIGDRSQRLLDCSKMDSHSTATEARMSKYTRIAEKKKLSQQQRRLRRWLSSPAEQQ